MDTPTAIVQSLESAASIATIAGVVYGYRRFEEWRKKMAQSKEYEHALSALTSIIKLRDEVRAFRETSPLRRLSDAEVQLTSEELAWESFKQEYGNFTRTIGAAQRELASLGAGSEAFWGAYCRTLIDAISKQIETLRVALVVFYEARRDVARGVNDARAQVLSQLAVIRAYALANRETDAYARAFEDASTNLENFLRETIRKLTDVT